VHFSKIGIGGGTPMFYIVHSASAISQASHS
jgi:hypothetical protein